MSLNKRGEQYDCSKSFRDQGIFTGITIVFPSHTTHLEPVFPVKGNGALIRHSDFQKVARDAFPLRDVEEVVDHLGAEAHASKGRMYGHIQDVALVQGAPRTDIADNGRRVRLAEYKRIGVRGS